MTLAQKSLNVAMHWQGDFQYRTYGSFVVYCLLTYISATIQPVAPISVVRTLRGFSQANGKLSLVLRNHQPVPQSLIYLETMPWLVQFYLHTLQARVEGHLRGKQKISPPVLRRSLVLNPDDIISNISYIAAVPHSRPTTFQAVLRLPPKSVTHLTMDVDKAFLRYTEHPPDAQRGWDLPPAVLTPLTFNTETDDTHSFDGYQLGEPIYTSILLVDVATPDFSMPYNVIIFTCSLVAFIFGSIFNLLTRKFVVLHLDPDQQR